MSFQFKKFMPTTLGAIPSSYLHSLSYEEQFLCFAQELTNYVNNYFENLDITQEITNVINNAINAGKITLELQTLYNEDTESLTIQGLTNLV